MFFFFFLDFVSTVFQYGDLLGKGLPWWEGAAQFPLTISTPWIPEDTVLLFSDCWFSIMRSSSGQLPIECHHHLSLVEAFFGSRISTPPITRSQKQEGKGLQVIYYMYKWEGCSHFLILRPMHSGAMMPYVGHSYKTYTMSSLEWCGLLVLLEVLLVLLVSNKTEPVPGPSSVLSSTQLVKPSAHKKTLYSVSHHCISFLLKYVLWMDMMMYGNPWQWVIDYVNPQMVLVKRCLRSTWWIETFQNIAYVTSNILPLTHGQSKLQYFFSKMEITTLYWSIDFSKL